MREGLRCVCACNDAMNLYEHMIHRHRTWMCESAEHVRALDESFDSLCRSLVGIHALTCHTVKATHQFLRCGKILVCRNTSPQRGLCDVNLSEFRLCWTLRDRMKRCSCASLLMFVGCLALTMRTGHSFAFHKHENVFHRISATTNQDELHDDDVIIPNHRRSLFRYTLTAASTMVLPTSASALAEATTTLIVPTPPVTRDLSWPLGKVAFSLLPLAGSSRRATVEECIVPGKVWTHDQIQGIVNVNVPVRQTVIALQGGGLWVHNPVAPTPQLLKMMQKLEQQYGPVKHIVLGTVALEHKATLGPFAQNFRQATVWIQPGIVLMKVVKGMCVCSGFFIYYSILLFPPRSVVLPFQFADNSPGSHTARTTIARTAQSQSAFFLTWSKKYGSSRVA